ncbi:MAG: cysteine synthase A [Muribaculaceae bacterium]|nr:cysteine synthase A [Muribaculaceae bacterium]
MKKIYSSLIELIGHTPLLEVKRIEEREGLKARLLVKLESYNPGGSVKDRVAFAMISVAEREGKIKPGDTIIEPTSGNTGIGLAWVGRLKGYKVILTMPETMSEERRKLLRAYGAELVLTPGSEGMKGAIKRAEELHKEIAGSIILGQFENPANPAMHKATTAKEIWNDTDGTVDIFVAGVGTGGTLSGTAAGLKQFNPDIRAYAVEPAGSAVLSGEKSGAHKQQGIGAGFIPDNYNKKVVDGVIRVTDEEAFSAARLLASEESVLVGISSGSAFSAALDLAKDPENDGKTIVVILPDTGDRYLSTPLFE